MHHPPLSRTVLRCLKQRSPASLGPIERRNHRSERHFSLSNKPPQSRFHDAEMRKSFAAGEMLRRMEADPTIGKPAPTADDIGAPPGASSMSSSNFSTTPGQKGGRPDYRNQRTLMAEYVKPAVFISLLVIAIGVTIQGEYRKREREKRIRTPRPDPGAEYEAERAARLEAEAALLATADVTVKKDATSAASLAENKEEEIGKEKIIAANKKDRH